MRHSIEDGLFVPLSKEMASMPRVKLLDVDVAPPPPPTIDSPKTMRF